MKPENLRIGNIINYKGNYSNYKGVTPLTLHLFSYLLQVDDEWNLVEEVSLNEDWLLKFGFKKYKKETDYDSIYELKNINIPKSGYFEFAVGFIENEINIFLYSGECLKHIKYVHQLQNLYFALTETELNIK